MANFIKTHLIAITAGLALTTAAGAAGLAFLLGFSVAVREWPTYEFMAKVDGKLATLAGVPEDRVEDRQIITHMLRIDAAVADVPDLDPDPANWNPDMANTGGGLTSFGEDVLVLPYSGRIFAARGAGDVRETDIWGPDNNRAAFYALTENPDYPQYAWNRGYLRYNDLLFTESEHFRGLIASFTEFHPGEMCYTNSLATLEFPADVNAIDEMSAAAEDWRILYRSEPCLPFKERHLAMEGQMAGGRMVFKAPSTIYLANGDYHWDGMRSDGELIAQNPDADYGKVVAVDLATGAKRIVSMGHRNTQGIDIDPSGRLLVLEHGPRGGDELNIIAPGRNYGWPLESYGTAYDGVPIPGSLSFGRHDTHTAPLHAWVPSAATSSLEVIAGFHDAWDGDLLAGALISQSLFRLRLQDGRVVYSEEIPIGARIRYVHQHTDGQLVVWTDKHQLIFLTPSDTQAEKLLVADYVAKADIHASVRGKVVTALENCGQCHSFTANDNLRAPSLHRIFEAEIGATDFAGYSRALARKRGTWSREALEAFLDDPEGFASGTFMPDPQIDDARVIDGVLSVLSEMQRSF
ncbi:MAG: PQQ-dependent sugar dehydrogenase [Caulobacterales bacterium]|nr:PQQ-dependent sugar dehydrogenase [Caulobacterales bacterium]